MRHHVLALAVLLAACGPSKVSHDGGDSGSGDGGSQPQPHTLVSISVTPTNPLIQVGLSTPASQDFTVTGSYADDTTEDLTTQATWTVANPMVGAFTNATLAIPGFSAATAVSSKVTASVSNVDGVAQITVVAVRPEDFFFILPYQDPNGNVDKPLTFATAVPALDVFFLMDVTGSMAGEINALQSALTGTIVPGIQAAVADAQFGVGSMADFPISPYGSVSCGTNRGDQPFVLKQAITATTSLVQTGVGTLSVGVGTPAGCGNDTPEAGLESIYQAATGEGLAGPSPTLVPANHTGVGGVGFRTGTMPVIMAISDAPSHGVGETGTCDSAFVYTGTVASFAHSRVQTKAALAGICARSIGIAPQPQFDTCNAVEYMTDLATTTGARVPPTAWDFTGTRPTGCSTGQCCTGLNGVGQATDANGLCPLVFAAKYDGTGVSASAVTGIQMLTRFATFDVTRLAMGVTTDINGVMLPGAHTTADFLKTITPSTAVVPSPPPVITPPTKDTMEFYGVTPGTQVGFDVSAFNDFVPATNDAQIFHATIQVLAGGCTPLDQREVIILVPPAPVVIN